MLVSRLNVYNMRLFKYELLKASPKMLLCCNQQLTDLLLICQKIIFIIILVC